MIFESHSFDPKSVKVAHKIIIEDKHCQSQIAWLMRQKSHTQYLACVLEFLISDQGAVIVSGTYGNEYRFVLLTDEEAKVFLSLAKEGYGFSVSELKKALNDLKNSISDCEDKIKVQEHQIKYIEKIKLGSSDKTKTEPPPEIKLPGRPEVNNEPQAETDPLNEILCAALRHRFNPESKEKSV